MLHTVTGSLQNTLCTECLVSVKVTMLNFNFKFGLLTVCNISSNQDYDKLPYNKNYTLKLVFSYLLLTIDFFKVQRSFLLSIFFNSNACV